MAASDVDLPDPVAPKKNQAAFAHDELGRRLGQAELIPLGDIGNDEARNNADFIALSEDVDPEPSNIGQRTRQIHRELCRKRLPLTVIHQVVSNCRNLCRSENLVGQRLQDPLELGAGWRSRSEVEIRAVSLCHDFNPVFELHC